MTREVATVSPETTAAQALEEIRAHNIRHLPVLDGSRLVGVVTDRDLRLVMDPDGSAVDTPVSEVMTPSPVEVGPDTPVESAAALLTAHRIGCLPVVEAGELVGILTESDLLRAFVDLMVGREPHSRVEILAPDRPGELARVVRLIGIDHGINITGVVVPPTHSDRALVILHLETDRVDDLIENLRQLGYEAASPALPERPA
jgi:acetoin utilization protein AcuB